MDAVVANDFNYSDWAENLVSMSAIPLEDLSPGGGAYLNEASFQQPDWQWAIYGNCFEKLSEIKSKYDHRPGGLFYALDAIASENWS